MKTTPTIGRRLYFFPCAADIALGMTAVVASQPFDAGVIFVHQPVGFTEVALVNLAITDHVGGQFVRHGVPLVQDGDAYDPSASRCEWMPYQVQAAQALAAESQERSEVFNVGRTMGLTVGDEQQRTQLGYLPFAEGTVVGTVDLASGIYTPTPGVDAITLTGIGGVGVLEKQEAAAAGGAPIAEGVSYQQGLEQGVVPADLKIDLDAGSETPKQEDSAG